MSKPIYESLVKNGKVVRGFLGVSIQDLTHDLAKSFGIKDAKGALVSDVRDEGPADQAGLKQGDIITPIKAHRLKTPWRSSGRSRRPAVGTKVTVQVIRDGHEKELTVTIGEQPETTKIAKAETGETGYAFAGVAVQDLDRDTVRQLGVKGKAQGVMVTAVEPDSVAERAGVMRDDVIREINQQPVKSVKDFERCRPALRRARTS